MSLRALSVFLRLMAWVAPATARGRWSEEWLAEIELVARERGARTAARVALGAAPDAFSFRRLSRERARLRDSEDGKGPMRLGISTTDLKLAIRMLVRYPGLTLVGVLGMAVGITIAAGAITIVSALMNPALPFEEGERIVAIGNWDVRTNNQE